MDQVFSFLQSMQKYTKNADLLIAGGMMAVLAVMIIPLPSWVLDLALSMSLTLSILVLLVSIYTQRALDFSVFPSLLLMTTLFRLSLNVASTRVILSRGHEGTDAAGQVISAFGSFVVGDNYVIGLIVFVILVVINFVVITKGSGRVAEVAARFTLDAMPGKQMSIDADLSAGLISDEEARTRRKEIEMEADFYGAMDGASKFVRGDAIAGILITLINIVGGLLVGMFQRELDMSTAAQYYTMLTIGDGLVGQIPALIISTAAGTVVTRNSRGVEGENMGTEMTNQLFLNPRAVATAATVIGLLSLVPGLPTVPFMTIGIILGGTAWAIHKFKVEDEKEKMRISQENEVSPTKDNIENLLPLELIELEVGYGLINIVESDKSGDLLERVLSIRKQFAVDLGVIVPSVHIRDNLQLEPGEYQILIKGNSVGKGVLRPESLLAMDPGNVLQEVEGVATKEPAFGLDALWIDPKLREDAEINGYTVVDLPTVMATHLTEVVRAHAHELLGRQEASNLIDNLKKSYPKVVEELIPDILSLGVVVKVMQNLLREQISIRDLLTIFETLADEGARSKDPEVLTEAVRKAMARTITAKLQNELGAVPVMSLHPSVEELVSNSLLQTDQGVQLVMDPNLAQDIISNVSRTVELNPEIAGQPILLTSPTARRHLYKLISRFIPQLAVISHNELSSEANIQSVGVVEVANAG